MSQYSVQHGVLVKRDNLYILAGGWGRGRGEFIEQWRYGQHLKKKCRIELWENWVLMDICYRTLMS
jgi:hypothetical protein